MDDGTGPWQEARRAWRRLDAWWHGSSSAASPADAPDLARGGPSADPAGARMTDADAALTALSDIGLLRRLLDQAELDAVRCARRGRRSWTEIAVRLGVTRQSAWERWRDLDETPPTDAPATPAGSLDSIAADLVDQATRSLLAGRERHPDGIPTPPKRANRAARMLRLSVAVPDVIGLSWDAARHRLVGVGLVGAEPDAGPQDWKAGVDKEPPGVVTAQIPEAGARVPAGSLVTLWLHRGGGSAGVREPRRPGPSPRSARVLRPEPTDEAVG
ncbi:PASTA domain-containing protein [Frankia sp. AgKG'84/4]|uniref:PASTA domain-containing protein n=1 Tax=Frankia sp. AgKG'84/4 TaxID=573490 RepID=UPI00200E3A85|nr:PASTA domain-containing protein [Frankia sp. AgKG'84/4]MCL9796244.1 PASTA domain-containing protein [Frankia sp. AgKG'84/4]